MEPRAERRLRTTAISITRSRLLTGASRLATRHTLRVLAYHTVPDPDALERQLDWLTANFNPVSSADVERATRGGSLPQRPVWLTFDDGDPSVVEHALPLLSRRGLVATMFICPGLIESGKPFWWNVVEAASPDQIEHVTGVAHGPDTPAVEWFKKCDDSARRELVDALNDTVQVAGHQLDTPMLERWVAGGNDLGNHTWDHPCLDRCSPEEQKRQVTEADNWIRDLVPGWRPAFAYPNGNWTTEIDSLLEELDYDLAVLHDHRLTNLSRPLMISRLEIESDDPVERLASVVSGLQPALKRASTRLRPVGP